MDVFVQYARQALLTTSVNIDYADLLTLAIIGDKCDELTIKATTMGCRGSRNCG
jgi:hypothetical protein